jgi:hypothetical protein
MSSRKRNNGQTNNSSLATEPQAKEALWQLHAAAMGSPVADAWEAKEREMQVLFYRMLGELFDTLPALQRV